ncbi:uncharacterized protein APUU_60771A [Aspergillus puulaauensis]|uniref:Xylanolytic transcriptional activator regulatory domain-containing protein n=1 Tax=Aspergillus puulaauensis TaxID=1220207 RepID=A0A7R7XVJ3_9EURO|nr:uncharacterized protein APUU_60771A [Aspergillus puulaauensis]BCS27723.1 hypothetical protein APUU_60771A [Aspergillus puulaauensis]
MFFSKTTCRDLLVRHIRLSHATALPNGTQADDPQWLRESFPGPQNDSQASELSQLLKASEMRSSSTVNGPPISTGTPPPLGSNGSLNTGLEQPRSDQWPNGTQDTFQELAFLLDDCAEFTDDVAPYLSADDRAQFEAVERAGILDQILEPDATSQPASRLRGEMPPGMLFSRMGSRLPSLQPPDATAQQSESERPVGVFERITVSTWDVLVAKLHEVLPVVPDGFVLPSRLALSRYLTAYLENFHEHMPFLHIPTVFLHSCHIDLVLAIASIGAQYCFESNRALQLFRVSRAIAEDRLSRRRMASSNAAVGDSAAYEPTQIMQTLLLLLAKETWSGTRNLQFSDLSIQYVLAGLVREDGFQSIQPDDDASWGEWAAYETLQRTKWITFCFFNLHTLIYSIPSPIHCSELSELRLPCHDSVFRAKTESEWRMVKSNIQHLDFGNVFGQLFTVRFSSALIHVSTLTCYTLMHALIQQIYLVGEVSKYQPTHDSALPGHDAYAPVEVALQNWKSLWKRMPESSIDPSNPAGPMAFNSTALLRLAYVRLSWVIGPSRTPHTWDPQNIANAFLHAQTIKGSPRLLRAVLHAAHALSIPIQLGIHRVAQTQTFRWSVQHSLAALECAFLLCKWLEGLSQQDTLSSLTAAEHRMVLLVKAVLDETDYASPHPFNVESPRDMRHLCANVFRVWAQAFHGPVQVWHIVDIIRESFELCALRYEM